MLRNKNLIPLSHQHRRALVLCVRIDRASPIAEADLLAWQAEIRQHFESEIAIHFAAEEEILFPAAHPFRELTPLVEGLLADHVWLRARFAAAQAKTLSAENVTEFARRLSDHIRKEERQLFQRLQELLRPEELDRLGYNLELGLSGSAQACSLPRHS